MRILHVVSSYLPAVRYGGTIASVHGICRALAARGHDVHVFTTSVDGDADSSVPHEIAVDLDGVKVWYFRSPRFRRVYWAPSMRQRLRADVGEFDLVHTHAVYLWPLWAAARCAFGAGVPYVVSPRGMLEKGLIEQKSTVLKAGLIACIEKQTLERAAAIHVTSTREAEQLAAFGFDLPPLVNIPNGVDLDLPDPSASPVAPAIRAIVDGPPYVLFLGRISWKKGLDRLVASVPHLSPGVRLVIAGNDEERLQPALQAQIDTLKVSDRVVFVGAVGGQDKRALLAHAQALVLPSYSENFGNVVVESMAAGRPVVVTSEVGVAPLVRDAGAGWVVDGDPRTLGVRISELFSNPSLMREMGERGRAAAQREFSWPRVAERMEAAYRTVLAARPGPGSV